MSGPEKIPGADKPVLEVSGYSLTYDTPSGPLHALQNIDLQVAHGQTHGLVGESGSGKSSLAWAILRYLPENAIVNDGKLLLSGESLRDRTLPQILEIISILKKEKMDLLCFHMPATLPTTKKNTILTQIMPLIWMNRKFSRLCGNEICTGGRFQCYLLLHGE